MELPTTTTPAATATEQAPSQNGNGNGNGHGHATDGDVIVRTLLRALRTYKKGDFSVRMPLDLTGPAGEVAEAFNDVIERSENLAQEIARLNAVVGKEGRLDQRGSIGDVSGSWRSCVDSLNGMIDDLIQPTAEAGRVIRAVASGNLDLTMSVEIEGRPLQGEFLRTAMVVNGMVEQLRAFASEVTRVAREVGTEGKLGGQAEVQGVAGTWKDLTDNVNSMASNLTSQVRNIAEVTTAVAKGDLSKKITVDVKGEILELKKTINTMVDQLNGFASEVTRVAREVGTEGKLGGQAEVQGVAGTWKDLTDNVNSMASNLTSQVRNIAEVTTAVALGDLSKKITVDVKGEILALKNTINTMVDQLRAFASEVTRVAREVGTEGKLGGQAEVQGVAGTWKDLTDNVNSMASNLTSQVRNIAEVTTAVALGDLSRKITVDVKGEILELKKTINTMVDQLNGFASEVTRVAREVGTEGKLGGQAEVKGVGGTWKDLTDNVNSMASNLTSQVRNIAEVTTAVALGDLSKKITVDVKGEILALKNTINTMVDQLRAFASEVTRVAREVGTEGKLGGQAEVQGVAGTWKDLTDNVNSMASNLTSQVRGIATVVTAVANGELTRKLALEARGEIARLAETINGMTDTLATFAEQVTTVAREVGVDGKLGGQAKVPGAAGTWKDLTDNVNQLAGNLTTQVRAIGDVATSVTKGDLTRSVSVEASGEVAALKDNINEMIRALRETTQKTTEQDWLKSNLARFTRMLQGQRDLVTVAQQILSELAPLVGAQYGVFYIAERQGNGADDVELQLLASYASRQRRKVPQRFRLGEGLVGQCALEKRRILLDSVPPAYVRISSGLGEAPPLDMVVLPVLFEGQCNAVIELASFGRFSEIHRVFLDQLTESIGIVINTISASMRTEGLLQQSQSLTHELQLQQEELRQTNERLERQANTLRESEDQLRSQQDKLQQTNEQLEEKAKLLELKNREVGFAKREVEEQAEQLALTSKYKSQFLANMSHELRTPLNSLLILSKMLSDNVEGNLSTKQVDFARTIHGSGTDLLVLINDILDLSKIESGTMTVDVAEVYFVDLRDYVEQSFRHVAEQKGLQLNIELDDSLPKSMHTDAKRLQQILKNLVANAIKFTERGTVNLRPKLVRTGWGRDQEILNESNSVIAFEVRDTGIGISEDKQRIIFEAFQQADGTTSRKYGGTGLGLSISRELARLLGGEVRVTSAPGEGSTFTLFLPQTYVGRDAVVTEEEDEAALIMPASATLPHANPLSNSGTPPSTSWARIDDRERIAPGDRVLLIVEDDDAFARILLDVAREEGWRAVVASEGSHALALVRRVMPSAICLDLHLPDTNGWVLLDQLKHDATTRHIPVRILSGTDGLQPRALVAGALGFMLKPVTREAVVEALADFGKFLDERTRSVLVVEADDRQRDSLAETLKADGIEVATVPSTEAALQLLEQKAFRCITFDVALPNGSAFTLLDRLKAMPRLAATPLVADVGTTPSAADVQRLRAYGERLAIQEVGTPDELLEHVTLHLHSPEEKLSEAQRRVLSQSIQSSALTGATVLVIDDDVRNIFAVTSVLERHEATVLYAEGGREALALLERTPAVDVVLTDIMMPEMDGYEVIRRIRSQPRYEKLPIIAVTAKAMKTDRDKCIQAGASDYISKPVDVTRLISMIRVATNRGWRMA